MSPCTNTSDRKKHKSSFRPLDLGLCMENKAYKKPSIKFEPNNPKFTHEVYRRLWTTELEPCVADDMLTEKRQKEIVAFPVDIQIIQNLISFQPPLEPTNSTKHATISCSIPANLLWLQFSSNILKKTCASASFKCELPVFKVNLEDKLDFY